VRRVAAARTKRFGVHPTAVLALLLLDSKVVITHAGKSITEHPLRA